jgi:hypothetical protein
MKKHNFILVLLIAIFIGFSVQKTFAQKKGGVKKDTTEYEKWKKDKTIVLTKSPPKQLSFEITVKGEGGCGSRSNENVTCNWSIDRKYSGTVNLDGFMPMPFEQMTAEPETASAIVQKKIAAKVKANPAAAYNSKWFTSFSPSQEKMWFAVNLNINDKLVTKTKFKKLNPAKDKKDSQNLLEERTQTTTETWITDEPGKAVRYFDVLLNRQTGNYEITFTLQMDAKVKYRKEISEEGEDDLPSLPQDSEAPPVPQIKDYLQTYIKIPVKGDTPNDKTAAFQETFSNGKSVNPLLGGIKETTAASVTVTYVLK